MNLIGEIAGKHPLEKRFCEFYSFILKQLQALQFALSQDQVFSTFAPTQLKDAVKELFQCLKKLSPRGALQQQTNDEEQKCLMGNASNNDEVLSEISGHLEEIFHEDERFYELLSFYLTDLGDSSTQLRYLFSQIKSLKDIRLDHLTTAFNQIASELQDPDTISTFMEVDISNDFQALRDQICKQYHQTQKLDAIATKLFLHDLIKKRCTFAKFITLLQSESSEKMLFTQQFFLSLLLNNSDVYLRTMILMACSLIMPLPLVSYQPKSQKNLYQALDKHDTKTDEEMMMTSQNQELSEQTQKEFIPYVYEQLFFCFEKHMAVLTFKVSASSNKSPQGCTSLANYLFNRTFQTHSDSMVNYGSIEIQFDYNFEKPMYIPVADAHGLVEEEILERVYPMFNIFIIHTFQGEQHQESANRQINKIKEKVTKPLIFMIIHEDSKRDNNFTVKTVEDITWITISSYKGLLEETREKLRTSILKSFWSYIGETERYEANIPARLKSLQEFSDFASGFRVYSSQFEQPTESTEGFHKVQFTESLGIIRDFLSLIDQHKDGLRSEAVLPMNALFEEACRLDKKMSTDKQLKNEQCESMRLDIKRLFQQMQGAKSSLLTQELQRIIDNKNFLGLTSIIAKLIKSLLAFKVKRLQTERDELLRKIQDQKQGKDEIEVYRKNIEIEIEKSQFSNEFLFRESYIRGLSQIRSGKKLDQEPFLDYLKLTELQISQGQPFEIIDGNNLQFIKEVYQKILRDNTQDQNILVVAVVGPQSSGKSLLLNTLFGTQFLSSAGRCTRGIYGCLIDVKITREGTNFSKILILDTEGIQSVESPDENFDRRVVFYILCISHIVLICNKQEMNKAMEDIIKLASDCFLKARDDIDMQPQVNIIMNNVHINESTQQNAVTNLQNSLSAMNNQSQLRQLFTIDKENVFLLPNAFTHSGHEGFVSYQPSQTFAQYTDELRAKIFNDSRKAANSSFESWLKKAQKIWEFADGFVLLTEHSTLEEREEDQLLFQHCQKLIASNFENAQGKQNQDMIRAKLDGILAPYQEKDPNAIKYDTIKDDIDYFLHLIFEEITQKISNQFMEYTKGLKVISPQTKQKRERQLVTQIRQNLLNLKKIAIQRFNKFNQKKSRLIGDRQLQKAIDHYIEKDVLYTEDEAEEIFFNEWNKLKETIEKKSKPEKAIQEAQFDDIRDLYQANSGSIFYIDQDRTLFFSYLASKGDNIIAHLQNYQEFLYYNSRSLKPTIEVIKDQMAKEKHFIQKKKIDFFLEEQVLPCFDWKKIIKQRFNFALLKETLIGHSSQYSIIRVFKSRSKFSEEKARNLFDQIIAECHYFCVDLKEYFLIQLIHLDEERIQKAIRDRKSNSQDENQAVAEAINQFVNEIEAQIERYFQFYQGKIPSSMPAMMYFDTKAKGIQNRDPYHYQNYISYIEISENTINQQMLVKQEGKEPLKSQILTMLTIKSEFKQQRKHEHLSEYLLSLIQSDRSDMNQRTKPVQDALSYFFESIDHQELLRMIQSIVLASIFKTPQDNRYSTVEDLIEALQKSDDSSILFKFNAMGSKTIQNIVLAVEGIVKSINDEIDVFRIQVSEKGRSLLHQITQTYIIRIMSEITKMTENAQLLTFIKNRDREKASFIAKLTSNDKAQDKSLAERTAAILVKKIKEKIKEEQKEEFRANLSAACKGLFSMRAIKQKIEEQVLNVASVKAEFPNPFLTANELNQKGELTYKQIIYSEKDYTPQEIIESYVKPQQFLIKKFTEIWDTTTRPQIKRAQQMFGVKIAEQKNRIIVYFQEFLEFLKIYNIQLSTTVFFAEGGQVQDSSQVDAQLTIQKDKIAQKAMAIYLGRVVTGQWEAGKPIFVGQVKITTPEGQNLVKPDDFLASINQHYALHLEEAIRDEPISNIRSFIGSLITEMQEMKPETSALLDAELLGDNFYQDMKTKTLGCDEMCPLCRKQCDQSHENEPSTDRIHKCEEGHQLQGFGGNRWKKQNWAITYGCHELEDIDSVFWKGQDLKWPKFKRIIQDERKWDLEEGKKVGKKEINDKNIKIWNIIGPSICYYFKAENKIDIKFIEADKNQKYTMSLESNFYILMLDNSGSMADTDSSSGSRWESLKSAVSSFIKKIEGEPRLKQSSKISIITYNSTAKLEAEAQVPSQDILKSLQSPGGGTDFNAPLIKAAEQIDKYHASYDHITLAMMSDGDAGYPSEGVQRIKSSPGFGKIKFKSIAYGEGTKASFWWWGKREDNLAKIATELRGSPIAALEPDQLQAAFIQMIPNY